MSSFTMAMNACARTWNNAVSYVSPDTTNEYSGRLALFFKGVRGLTIPRLYEYLHKCSQENLVDTFLLVFQLRDCRGGKGERELGRKALIWLFVHYPEEFSTIAHLIPEYGRWDDLLCFFPHVLNITKINLESQFSDIIATETLLATLNDLQTRIVKIMADQLVQDRKLMDEGKPCSLCAKWTPTEGDSLDKEYNVFKTLARALSVSTKNLRRQYNTPLRSYLRIVESFICKGLWSEVDFNKVPSHAMKRLKKAFAVHDSDRFAEWRDNLKLSTSKVNAKQLHPHELVGELRKTNRADPITEAQWNVLIDEVRKLGTLTDSIAVVDTSSSMTCPNNLPLDVAVSLGMIISQVVKGPFHGNLLTFNTKPAFAVIPDGNMFTRYNAVKNMKWGGSTNLEKTFMLILERARVFKLTDADMPKRLFIISDMQFDCISGNTRLTNLENINQKYAEYGYTRPQIVFWNVNGSSDDFPTTVHENGTVLISGFSPAILQSVINSKNFSSIDILQTSLRVPRYDSVRRILTNVRVLGEDFEMV